MKDEALIDRANGDIATMTINHYERILRERDEAREALSDWENAALHVEAEHPDEKHCGCVPVLRKLLADARKERDEAREAMREAWLAMDEIDGTDRIVEWQNKYANILEETK